VDPVELLERARQAGLTVRAEGGTLVVEGPKRAAAIAEELLEHKAELLALLVEPERWDEALADAWPAITLERIGKLHDELAPDCNIDTIEWDQAEAVVNAAYAMRNRQALRNALDDYEVFARQAFEAWAHRKAA
jgi:hypothetical protein